MLVRRVRHKRKAAYSNHWTRKYPNLIKEYTSKVPNQLRVSDITCLDIKKVVYLSLITDAYSHKIIGWNADSTLRASSPIKALKMAPSTLPVQKRDKLAHRSDRGGQYCCARYAKLLNKRNIMTGMTESDAPRENAGAERMNGILKTERLNDASITAMADMSRFMSKITGLHNNERTHQSINYLTPQVVHATGIKTERRRQNYY
jgi:transposase InsO family protein